MRGGKGIAVLLALSVLVGAVGCGQQTDIRAPKSEKAQEAVAKARRFDPAVLRADTPEAIDAEFAARLADKRKARRSSIARKMESAF